MNVIHAYLIYPLQLTWVHLTLETGADAVTGNCHGDLQVLVISMETTP